MPILSANPVIVPPATVTYTFDTWWISDLRIATVKPSGLGIDPNSPPVTMAVVNYQLGRMDGNNFVAYLDAQGNTTDRRLQIADIFALAQSNADVAATITNLVSLLGTLGMANGVIN